MTKHVVCQYAADKRRLTDWAFNKRQRFPGPTEQLTPLAKFYSLQTENKFKKN